jgi:hypothetical protein
MTRRSLRTGLLTSAAVAALTASGCATSGYAPQVVARGELTVRYDGGFELSAGGRRVAKGLSYGGLDHYVRCVPEAHRHARQAQTAGGAAIAFSVLGGVLGAGGLTSLISLVDTAHWREWIAGGLGMSVVGLTFSILSWRYKNHANGHAIDAMNFYNDSVGSLGATCDELVYPPSAGPAPPTGPVPLPGAVAPNMSPNMIPSGDPNAQPPAAPLPPPPMQ